MAASGLLRERDLRALTAVIEDGLRDDPGPAMPWAVFDRLQQLIPCDIVQFGELDPQRHRSVTEQVVDDGERFIYCGGNDPHWPPQDYWTFRARFLPYSYQERTGDAASVILWSDFYTQFELKDTPYLQFLADLQGFEHTYGIFVPLPTAAGRIRLLGFLRSNRDFSERDRLALQLLRPHLHEVFLDAQRRRHGIPHLSRREREVLQLAAQGYSNADIAQVLFISVATVAKHMEHIFDRTGVRTRSAAAALALPQVNAFAGSPLGNRGTAIDGIKDGVNARTTAAKHP